MKIGMTGAAVAETPASESLEGDARWKLAQRVVASKGFASSVLLTKFLLYVCDRQLRGRVAEITEHQIGVQVFGRRTSYNPGNDNIVRHYARLLRKRLDEYFAGEGRGESIRISIPRGGYIPAFHLHEPIQDAVEVSLPEAEALDAGQASRDNREHEGAPVSVAVVRGATASPIAPQSEVLMPFLRAMLHRYQWVAACVIALGVIASYFFVRPRLVQIRSGSHLLWSQLFSKDKQTFVVPADSGLVILEDIAGRSLSLREYENRQYLYNLSLPASIDSDTRNDLNSARYTSVSDLNVVSKLSRLPELVPNRFVIRYARELHLDDIKHSNVVLIGSVYSNPWVELFQDSLNFQFDYRSYADFDAIVNKHPRAGEPAIFHNTSDGDSSKTYAVVALLPNLDGTGKVLILEGLTMAGTEAAEDLLFNDAAMKAVLEKASEPNGSLKPFELLIEATGIAADAPTARVVASRYY
jgi:hypothetical protein